eukprot:TRINITY_DN10854_c0_g1_i4.p1 TRINITY_DN10854_c0_g1~~TRINITY_DN10854_c0_g1_i4.p1  ORF type:complete len:132 (-),score=33.00 TRINITY_DN10854_c0_g1_i4:54-449(-)
MCIRDRYQRRVREEQSDRKSGGCGEYLMAGKRLTPMFDRVLVQRLNPMTKTAGGILLNKQKKVHRGTVVAIGRGRYGADGKLQTVNLKVGDEVMFKEYGGSEVSFSDSNKDEELLLFREEDILGTIVESND